MKMLSTTVLLLAAAGLTACSGWSDVPNPGNPNATAYAGEPGSVYDPSANPPRNIGQVAYDPNQPLENNLAYDERLPRPGPDATPVAAEATLAPRQSHH